MGHFTRREFLEQSMFATAAAAAVPSSAFSEPGRTAGPNEALRIAVVGTGGRGADHIGGWTGKKDAVRLAALCDVDDNALNSSAKNVEAKTGQKPALFKDIRKLLEDKTIDAISIATPNHWHSLAALWAVQAGKHVYVEKPVSHNVFEGRKLVEAARKYKKIVQTGTQCRSSKGLHEAMDFMWAGKIGKVTVARGLCYKGRGSIGKTGGAQAVPTGLDYDLWLGPAQDKPSRRKRFHYDWHWFWDYGNGDLGNQGIHQMDIARWGLRKPALATKVLSVGCRLGYEDDAETANTQIVCLDYTDSQLIFEVRGLKTEHYKGAGVGVIFHGSEGYIVIPSYTDATAFTKDGQKIQSWKGGGDHYGNFINAVRSGNPKDLAADIEEGHISSALCHLGNISYRLGVEQPLSKNDPFGSNAEGNESFNRFREHLDKNGVRADAAKIRVGKSLAVDPKTEKFVGDAEADKMLTREYRKGFVVPETV